MAPGCAAPEAGSKDRPELGLLCCSRALLLQQFHELVNGEIRLSDELSYLQEQGSVSPGNV